MTSVEQVTDFLVAHLPNAQYIHRMWSAYGHPPLWNSSILSGMPLVADPLSGYFYLPNWLTFIFPTPAAFNILFVLHLVWSGIGLYIYLREKKIHSVSALFGTAVWIGTPKLIGYVGSGQVSTIFALSWFPWLMLAIDWASSSLSVRKVIVASSVLATIILTDIRWGYLAGILSFALLLSRLVYQNSSILKKAFILCLFMVSIIVLTAALIFPLGELMMQSDRAYLHGEDRAILSVTYINLFGLVTPQFGILYELITYMGIPALIFSARSMKRPQWFWISVVGFGILYSLGENSFFFGLINNYFPGFNWLRVPSRVWFLVALGISILSAHGLEQIIYDKNFYQNTRFFRRIILVLSIFAVLLAIGVAVFYPPVPNGILSFAVFTPLTFLLTNQIRREGSRWVILLFVVAISDLLWVNGSLLRSIPLQSKPEVVHWLEAQPGLFRVYSPSYSIPLPHNLQTAEGVNPTHLRNYGQFMAKASGIVTEQYSVSVPGIYIDNYSGPQLINAAASPDLKLLGLLNVKYIVSSFPMKLTDQPVFTFGDTLVYSNPGYRERAWIENSGFINITDWSPDQFTAEVKVKAEEFVTFSEIYYPGWEAKVDNEKVTIKSVDNLLRGVLVPAGNHVVTLTFVPYSFYLGLFISCFGWAMCIYFGGFYVQPLVARIRSVLS